LSTPEIPQDRSAAANAEADALLDDHLPNQHAFGMQSEASVLGNLNVAAPAGDPAEGGADSGQPTADQVGGAASSIADATREHMSSAGSAVQEKADQGMDKAAEALNRTAETLRAQGEQRDGTMASVATKAADTLETTSAYLRDKDTDQLITDLESLVRRKPVEALLAAAGVGFVLSKLLR